MTPLESLMNQWLGSGTDAQKVHAAARLKLPFDPESKPGPAVYYESPVEKKPVAEFATPPTRVEEILSIQTCKYISKICCGSVVNNCNLKSLVVSVQECHDCMGNDGGYVHI